MTALSHFGFTWPWEVKEQPESESVKAPSGETLSVKREPEPVSEKIIAAKDLPEPGEAAQETPLQPVSPLPLLPKVQTGIEPIQKLKTTLPPAAVNRTQWNVRGSEVPLLARKPERIQPPSDSMIANVQEQIDEIIQLNERIKARQQIELKEIQEIMDQARIHQKMLDDLKATASARQPLTAVDTQDLLRQEKIRLIKEQTEKNREFVQNIEQEFIREKELQVKAGVPAANPKTERT